MSTVYLAEKPDQAKKYAQAFAKSKKGEGYFECQDPQLGDAKITWAVGHLVELVKPEKYNAAWGKWKLENLPMIPRQVNYQVGYGKAKQFNIVKKLLREASTIVWAGDIDREGSLISYLICLEAGVMTNSQKTFKRLWITDLLPKTVRTGMLNLRELQPSFLQAMEAQSRQIGDWLVGMNASPLYTLNMQKQGVKGTFAIGRVMTPTLFMIYKREQEIRNFKQETYFELLGKFQHANGEYTGKLLIPESLKGKWHGKTKQLADMQRFIAKFIENPTQGTIRDVTIVAKQTASPYLYQLSTLQTKMNRLMKASPANTLAAVQKLYERQFLTYPRTDIPFIGNGRFEKIKEQLPQLLSFLKVTIPTPHLKPNAKYVNEKKVAEHEAITPTEKIMKQATFDKLDRLQQAIYLEVVRTTVAMFADHYQYEQTTILTDVPNVSFKSVGNVPINWGWKALWGNSLKREKTTEDNQKLPKVQLSDPVKAKIEPVQKETKAPPRYTEGTLLIAMKTAGKTTDDVEAQTILKEVEGIGTEATRANVIEKLKRKDKMHQAFISVTKNQIFIEPKGNTICKAIETEPLLSSAEMTAQWEKFLKGIGQGERHQADFIAGIEKFLKQLIETAGIKVAAVDFSVEAQQMAATKSRFTKKAIGICPKCGGKVMLLDKVASCENNLKKAKTCDFHLFRLIAKKKIPEREMVNLLKTGHSGEISGFTSKAGKKFPAKLKIEGGKITFDFGNQPI